MKRTWLFGAVLVSLLASNAFSQDITFTPKTKVELFQSRTGVVVVSGSTVAGRLHAPATAQRKTEGEIVITSWIVVDTASGEKMKAISVDLADQAKRHTTAYIDVDEIDPLLAAIAYMGKADKSVTGLANLEAAFQTRGDFRLSTILEKDGTTIIGIRAGSIDPVSLYLPFDALGRFEKLLQDANALITPVD